jgi:hypothetical protein
MDRRKVPEILTKLEVAGWIGRQRRQDESGDSTSTMYMINYAEGVSPPTGTGVPLHGDTGSPACGDTVAPPTGTPGVPAHGALTEDISKQPNERPTAEAAVLTTGRDVSGEYSVEGDLSRGGKARRIGDLWAQKPVVKNGRGTRLPPEAILPPEWREMAFQRRSDIDPDQVFEQFKRYFTGPDAKQPVKKDWTRAWLNWIERERHGKSGRENRGLAAAAFAGAAAALGRSGRS